YIAQMPAAVSGQGGHNATFAVAIALRDFRLTLAEAWPILCEYSERCLPPWSQAELRHKHNDAFASPINEGRFPLEDFGRPGANGVYGAPGATVPGDHDGREQTPINLTDVGNARRLVNRHGADMRHCHPWKKWLCWDGRRWSEDDTGEAVRR